MSYCYDNEYYYQKHKTVNYSMCV